MKFIDEKGRIFGKINIIDLLLLLFLFCLLPTFYFGYHTLTRKQEPGPVVVAAPKIYKEVTIPCLLIGLKPEELGKIARGDRELQGAKTIGEIVALGEPADYRALDYSFEMGGQHRLQGELSGLKQIPATLKLTAEVNKKSLYYKDRVIQIHSPIEFVTEKYRVLALLQGEKITLTVKFVNVIPEVAQLVKAGDVKVALSANNSLMTVARIVKVVSNEPSEVAIIDEDTKGWLFFKHPQRNDLVLEIEAICSRAYGNLFFEDNLVRVGLPFGFSTYLYDLDIDQKGKIIAIKQ